MKIDTKKLEAQLKKYVEKIAKDAKMELSVYELFSKDFMSNNHLNFTIEELINNANVDIANFKTLSDNERSSLEEHIPKNKIKSWDDFFKCGVQISSY